ncbi:MAG: MTH938/NDUFAF3 family protein [Desulfobacteraceae bacterium]|nr:MTH938/NDUFAF3 family protein [Desulfobacteraceae bacterium]
MRIEDYRFGSIRIDGTKYKNDIKIVGNSVKPDWRRKNGHLVTRGDFADILESEPEIVIIGKGSPGMMNMDQKLAEELEKKGISLIVKPTQEAVKEFNRLQEESRNVAAGFHLTC